MVWSDMLHHCEPRSKIPTPACDRINIFPTDESVGGFGVNAFSIATPEHAGPTSPPRCVSPKDSDGAVVIDAIEDRRVYAKHPPSVFKPAIITNNVD